MRTDVTRITLTASAVLALSSAAQGQVAAPAVTMRVAALGECGAFINGVSEHELVSGGIRRSYRLFVPPGYDGNTQVPLVMELHGSGGTAAGQAATSGLDEVAAREGFLVASLQAIERTGNRWNVPITDDRPDDVAYVSDVIDDISASHCVDAARVYATGFSGGARMSSLLACHLNSRIAAVAPMAGLRWPSPCDGRAIPVFTVHGLADTLNTYEGGSADRGGEWDESVPDALAGWAGHNGCDSEVVFDDPAGPLSMMHYEGCRNGTEVRMIRVDGLGHTWAREHTDATAELWAFFQRHSL